MPSHPSFFSITLTSLITAGLASACATESQTDAHGDDDSLGEVSSAVTCAASVRVYPVRGRHNTGYDRNAGNASTWTCDADHSNSDFVAGDHLGIDIWAAERTPVVATVDGTLRLVEYSSYSGNKLTIVDACGWSHFYAHLHGFAPGIANGVRVRAGQVVGYVGKTGSASSGVVHLHYSLYPDGNYDAGVDPWQKLRAVERDTCGDVSGVGATMDVTGDGHGDLVMHAQSDTGAGELWIWQGYRDGFWATPKLPFQNSAFMANAKIAVTDVTGDGAADVILARSNGDSSDIHLIRGGANPTGTGTFIRTFGRPLDAIQLAAGDVTGDGNGDLVIHARSETGAGELWIFQGYDGGFWATPKLPFQNSAFMANAKLTVTDVTGDGAAEILLARSSEGGSDLHMIRGGANPTGTGTFIRTFGRPLDAIQLAGGDVTGDGNGDLVIHARSETSAGELWIFQGYDGGFWATPKLPFQNSAFMANAKLAVTDVTGDGAEDILLVRATDAGSDIHMLRGSANPTGLGAFLRSFGRPLERIELP